MGEAVYCGKLIFDTKEHAEAAEAKFKVLCLDINNAQEFWQRNRGGIGLNGTDRNDLNDKEFWDEFEALYPLSTDYIKSIAIGRHGETPPWGNDRNNGLAGFLEPIGCAEDVDRVFVQENEIRWSSEVWHFADWDPFIAFCKIYLEGCIGGGWISDEYADPDYWAMI